MTMMSPKELVKDVSKELKHASSYMLNKEAVDYDMQVIIEEQRCKKDYYKDKIKHIME